MENSLYCAIILFIIWYLIKSKKIEGFQNNDYYFQGNENDSMYTGRLIQPRLIHKINIPKEW